MLPAIMLFRRPIAAIAVFFVNLLLGWTLIGWFIFLV